MPELGIAEDHHFDTFKRDVRMAEDVFAVAAVSAPFLIKGFS